MGGLIDRLWLALVFGILRAEGVVVFHNCPLDFLPWVLMMRFSISGSRTPNSVYNHLRVQVVRGIRDMIR